MSATWVRASDDGVTIEIAVQPGARDTAVVGLHGGRLKIRVKAPPVEGAANEALCEFLAKALGVKRRQVELLKGATSRQKLFKIQGITPDAAIRGLSPGS